MIKILAWPFVLMGIAWAALALWIDGPANPWLATILSISFSAGCLILLIFLPSFFPCGAAGCERILPGRLVVESD